MTARSRIKGGGLAAVGVLCLWAPAALAQEEGRTDTLSAPGFGSIALGDHLLPTLPRTMPGSSAGSPTAWGPDWDDGYIAIGFTSRARYAPDRSEGEEGDAADGAVAVGFGIGDSRGLAGLEVNIASFSTVRRGFTTRMGVSLKLHRSFDAGWGVGLGYENAIRRGPVDADPSVYGVVSKMWRSAEPTSSRAVTASLGVGNGRFRFEEDVAEDRDAWNVFGSVGVQVLRPLSIIADWTGQDLALAVSVVPFQFAGVPTHLRDVALAVTAGYTDVTGHAGDGARFILGVGLGFHWHGIGGGS